MCLRHCIRISQVADTITEPLLQFDKACNFRPVGRLSFNRLLGLSGQNFHRHTWIDLICSPIIFCQKKFLYKMHYFLEGVFLTVSSTWPFFDYESNSFCRKVIRCSRPQSCPCTCLKIVLKSDLIPHQQYIKIKIVWNHHLASICSSSYWPSILKAKNKTKQKITGGVTMCTFTLMIAAFTSKLLLCYM